MMADADPNSRGDATMTPTVIHFIPCDGALADSRSLHRINVYGLTTKLYSDQDPPFPFRRPMQKVLVLFRGGQGTGEFVIRVVHEETRQIATQSQNPHRVQFVGDPREISGAVVQVRNCTFRQEGVYWLELVFAGEVIARQPIRVLP
jgi:hypothetical protein